MMNISKKYFTAVGLLSYSVISFLIIFHNHHYYDDELFNLLKLHLSYNELIATINNYDVHPVGSYIINKIIYDSFHSYKAIYQAPHDNIPKRSWPLFRAWERISEILSQPGLSS